MKNLFRRLIDLASPPSESDSPQAKPAESRSPENEALEPRMLFTGAAVDPAPVEASEQIPPAEESVVVPQDAAQNTAAEATETETVKEVTAPAAENAVPEQPGPAAEKTGSGQSQNDAVPQANGETAVPENQEVTLVEIGESPAELNQETLEAIADAAAERWRTTGLNDDQRAALDNIDYKVFDLGGHYLGVSSGSSISIDDDGAGRGWFLDPTPDHDEEFGSALSNPPEGIDLLSVILHEQGHILGLEGASGSGDVMNGIIGESERRLPAAGQADGAVAGSLEGIHHATAPTNLAFALDQTTIAENQSASLNGSFTLGSDTSNVISIDWGDGTIEDQLLTGGANTFAGTHQYLDNGNYSVSVSLRSGSLGLGLTGHWNFDDGAVTDQSGNGNDGTGGTINATDTPFGSGQALTDGSVNIPTSPSLETPDDQVTIAFWVKVDPSSANWSRTVTKASGSEAVGWHSGRLSSTTDLNIRTDTVGTGGGNNQNILGGGDGVFDNTWHHVVFTLDNGSAKEFVDGTLVQTQSYSHGEGLSNTGNLVIGSSGLNGGLDDVAVWNRVLSDAEITQVASAAIEIHQVTTSASLQVADIAPVIEKLQVSPNSAIPNDVMLQVDFTDPGSLDEHLAVIDWGDGGSTAEVSLATGARTLQSSHTYASDASHTINVTVFDRLGDAVGIWSFEGDATDASGNGNDGTGGTYSSDVASAFGTGQSHDGTGSPVTIANSTTLESVDDEMTLSFWLKAEATGPNAENNWFRVIRKGTEANGTTSWMVTRNSGTDDTLIRTDTVGTGGAHNRNQHTGAGPMLDGQWHHVAYVLDNGSTQEYVDGVLTSQSTYPHGDGLSNTEALTLGTQLNKGLLDEVILYDRALTSLQVGALAGAMDVAAAQNSASVEAAGGSVSISDTTPGGVNNNYMLALDSAGSGSGPEYVITDSTTGLNTRVLASTVTGEITFTGSEGDDTLTIDESVAESGLTINFDGQGNNSTDPGDQIVIGTAGGGGSVSTATYTFTNDHDGKIELRTGSTTTTINYTGLEPITDNMDATNRVLDFTGGAETITVTDNGATITVDSTEGETTTFNKPTGSLTITGAADDIVTFSNALTLSGANLTVDAGNINVVNAIGGQGGDISLTADSNTSTRGVHVAASISTSGVGTILLVGTGGGAAGQQGILVEADVTTEFGDLMIDGSSSGDDGVAIVGATVSTTNQGRIRISGGGGDGSSTFAVNVDAASEISTADGTIQLQTTAGSARIGGTVDSGAHALTLESAEDLNLADTTIVGGIINLEADNDVNLTSGTDISGPNASLGNVVVLSQNFEAFNQGSTGARVNNIALSENWQNAHFITDTMDFVSNLGGTPSGGTGPGSDHTQGNSSGTYLYLETSGSVAEGEFAHLLSPLIDLTAETHTVVEFYYHMLGAGMGELSVEGSSDGGTTWAGLLTVEGNQGNQWHQAQIDLSQFDGSSQFQLRLKGTKGTDFTGDIALDDFRFHADSGDLLTEDFESFGQGPTTNPRPQQMLPGISGWSNVVSSATLTPDADILDWSPRSGSTPSGGTGASADNTLGNADGTYLYIETSDPVLEDETAILYSPAIDLSAYSTASVEFAYHMWGGHMGDLMVYGSSDGGTNWSPALLTVSGDQGNQWNQESVNLDAFAGSSNFVLRVDGIAGPVSGAGAAGYQSDISLDDFRFFGDAVANTQINITADADRDFDGSGGAITMADGSQIDAGSGAVTLSADEDITVSNIATTSTIAATSVSGAILDGGDSGPDLVANAFVARTAAGVGTSVNGLDTTLGNLEADGGTEGVFVSNTGDLVLGDAGAELGVVTLGTVTIEGTNDLTLAVNTVVRGLTVNLLADNDVNFLTGSQIAGPTHVTLLQEDFESFAEGSETPGATNIPLANGWVNVQGTDQIDWSPDAGPTPSGSTGPSADHTTGNATGKFLYIETSDHVQTADTAILHAPTLDLSGMQSASLEFWYHMWGDHMGTLEVSVSTDGGTSFSVPLFSMTDDLNEWQKATLDLTPFVGSTDFILRVDGIAGAVSPGGAAGYQSDMAIDDFRILAVPVVGSADVTVTADADGDADGTGGAVNMDTGAGILTGDGNVAVNADGDVTISSITTTGAVEITSANGEIQDRSESPDITGGPVMLNGKVAVGLSSVGTLEVVGNLKLSSGSTFEAEISDTPANDQIRVTGTVDLTGSDLDLALVGTAPTSGTFVLIDNDGSDAVVGEFDGLTEGTIISLNDGSGAPDQLYQITYMGGVGNNDVVLTALGVEATTEVALEETAPGSGIFNLVINDIDEGISGGGSTGNSTDIWNIRVDGTDLVVTSNGAIGTLIDGATQTSINEVRIDTTQTPAPLPIFSGDVIINGLNGDDHITIGNLGASVLPGGIMVDGGDGFDNILYTGVGSVLTSGSNASFTGEEIDFQFSDLTTTDGNITLDGTGGSGGTFVGVELLDSDLTINGTGSVTLNGSGGDAGNSNHGVYLLHDSDISTTNGNIDIDGSGGGDANGVANKGVMIFSDSSLSAGGGGAITIDGTAGAGILQNEGVFFMSGTSASVVNGDMTITGTGSGTIGGGLGVSISGTMLTGTGTGDINISGTSAATGGFNNGGVQLWGTDVDTTGTGSGSVTISGSGAAGGTDNNMGVRLSTVNITTGGDASIDLDGTGAGSGANNMGVQLSSDANLTVSGTGTISIDGTGGNGTYNNDGVELGQNSDLEVANGNLTISGTGNGGFGSQGLSGSGVTMTGTGIGNILLTGTSNAAGSSNQGISLASTAVSTAATGSGTITLTGTGSAASLGSNEGVILSATALSTGGNAAIEIDGVGGGTASGTNNTGVRLLTGSTVAAGGSGAVTIDGTGGDGLLFNHGVSISGAGSAVTSGSGNITIEGTARGTYFNYGIEASFATIDTGGGDISMTGTSVGAANGLFNTGINLLYSDVGANAGNVTIGATGGLGSSFNEGFRMVGGSLSGTLSLVGMANGGTTGFYNSGVYILSADLGGAGGTITGTGGGGLGFNHGIYMLGGTPFGGTLSGSITDGNTATSLPLFP